MPNLHAHYYHGNVKAFRQELDGTPAVNGGQRSGAGPSSASGGRSWTLTAFAQPVKGDPNERDAFGRTVLHIAASTDTPQAYAFFSVLLRNPNLSVNLQDYESGYTALHRALYAGNIRAARDLLLRNDIDVSVKDTEGLTAFDLYNGTVEGTNPPSGDIDGTDLFVWGVNRNYSLGTGDSSDKVWPDRVHLLTQRQASDHPDPAQRFYNVGVKDAVMAKLHTGVVTTEARGNLSLCGFGAHGRLGRAVHSQMALSPLPDMPHTFTKLALGQDHTLALTSGGYILAWGSNRYCQLGYPMDDKPANPFARDGDDSVQTTPKRIVGPLKKEWVRGVAAGRMSSACWTADAVWTWGTNQGHLGYEKASTPTQVNPRKVTAISQPVIDVALSDYAMLCLLDSLEVLCFHHDTHFKINFSSPQRSLKAPKNPGQVTMDPNIVKVTVCGQTFATLSQKGDVCTFQLPHPSEEAAKDVRDRHVIVKPQIQWALRKNFTAVKDMALGSDGAIIICTHSGHVFVRQRIKAGSGKLKFSRIPYLQRIIKVATNDSGAFAAIRVDARPTKIVSVGKTLEEDMFLLQPHVRRFENQMTAEDFDARVAAVTKQNAEDDEDEASNSVARDSVVATSLCQILSRWRASDAETSLFAWSESLLGSDVSLVVGDHSIPAHSVLLSLRSPVFARLLSGGAVEGFTLRPKNEDTYTVDMAAAHPLVPLLLLQYLYSDEVAAIWDSRVVFLLSTKFPDLKLPIAQIKADLRRYAEILELAPLLPVLSLGSKSAIATKTLATDLSAFFARTSTPPSSTCDVVIALEDREVACQSVLLRARVPFFESMFADRDWTLDRRADGKVVVRMDHLRWRPMRLVFRYIHEGVEDDLFDYLHQETLDEFLDFVFEVLAAAVSRIQKEKAADIQTELLMDRLVLVCSRVIARHCNPYNAAALATEASFYQASTLKQSIFDYIIECMETMLESGLLDDMDDDVLRDLMATVSRKQLDKAMVPRSGVFVTELMSRHREWLALQDIPVPRVRAPIKWKPRSPLLQPSDYQGARSPRSPLATPDFKPLQPSSAVDEIFSMDDDDVPHQPSPNVYGAVSSSSRPMTPLSLGCAGSSLGKAAVWKSKTVQAEKVDLRDIMAEAAASRSPRAIPSTPAKVPVRGANGSPSLTPSRGPTGTTPGSAGAPWRAVAPATRTSFSAVQSQQAATTTSPVSASTAALSTSPVANVLSRPAGSMASPVPATSANRVITPVRLPTNATPQRRTGATGPAWSTPTTYAAPPPRPSPVSNYASISTSPQFQFQPQSPPQAPAQAFSLLAIQQEEAAAAALASQKAQLKSFAEIQAEETAKKAEAAREVEFMRWWQEEEARLAQFAGGAGPSAPGGASGSTGGGASGSGGRGRGRGTQKRVPARGGRGGGRGGRQQADGREPKEPKEPKERVSNRDPREARIDDGDVGVGGSSGAGGGGGGGGKGKGRGGGARRGKPSNKTETAVSS